MKTTYQIVTARHVYWATHLQWEDRILQFWGRIHPTSRPLCLMVPIHQIQYVQQQDPFVRRSRPNSRRMRGHFREYGEWVQGDSHESRTRMVKAHDMPRTTGPQRQRVSRTRRGARRRAAHR